MTAIFSPARVIVTTMLLNKVWPMKLLYTMKPDGTFNITSLRASLDPWRAITEELRKVAITDDLIDVIVAVCLNYHTHGKQRSDVEPNLAKLILAALEYEIDNGIIVAPFAFFDWVKNNNELLDATDDQEMVGDFFTAIQLHAVSDPEPSRSFRGRELIQGHRTTPYRLGASDGHTVYKVTPRQKCIIQLYNGRRYIGEFMQGKWQVLDGGPNGIEPWEVATYIPFEMPRLPHGAPISVLDHIRCTLRNDYNTMDLITILKSAVYMQGGTYADFILEMMAPSTSADDNRNELWVSLAQGKIDNSYALMRLAKWAYGQLCKMIGTPTVDEIIESTYVLDQSRTSIWPEKEPHDQP